MLFCNSCVRQTVYPLKERVLDVTGNQGGGVGRGDHSHSRRANQNYAVDQHEFWVGDEVMFAFDPPGGL